MYHEVMNKYLYTYTWSFINLNLMMRIHLALKVVSTNFSNPVQHCKFHVRRMKLKITLELMLNTR